MTYTKQLYEITVTVFEDTDGKEIFKAVARGLDNAVIVREALLKVFPETEEVESGVHTIKRTVKIGISPMFQHDIESFIEKSEFE